MRQQTLAFVDDDFVANAIELAAIDPVQLRRQLRRGGLTIAGSALAIVPLLAFLRWGPTLAAGEAIMGFAVSLLTILLALFAVGVGTTLGPWLTSMTLLHVRNTRSRLEINEVADENATLRRELDAAINILRHLGKDEQVATSDVYAEHRQALTTLLQGEEVPGR